MTWHELHTDVLALELMLVDELSQDSTRQKLPVLTGIWLDHYDYVICSCLGLVPDLVQAHARPLSAKFFVDIFNQVLSEGFVDGYVRILRVNWEQRRHEGFLWVDNLYFDAVQAPIFEQGFDSTFRG